MRSILALLLLGLLASPASAQPTAPANVQIYQAGTKIGNFNKINLASGATAAKSSTVQNAVDLTVPTFTGSLAADLIFTYLAGTRHLYVAAAPSGDLNGTDVALDAGAAHGAGVKGILHLGEALAGGTSEVSICTTAGGCPTLHFGRAGLTTLTVDGTAVFTSTISGSINGNAGTVTNGVYTTGDQVVAGIKTFSTPIACGSGGTGLSAGPGSAGMFLRATGANTWGISTLTLPNAATTGDLLTATGANAVGAVARGSITGLPYHSTTHTTHLWSAPDQFASGIYTVTTAAQNYAAGQQFRFTRPCTCTGIRSYYPDATTRTVNYELWRSTATPISNPTQSTGSVVASVAATHAAAGIVTDNFAAPFVIGAADVGAFYVASFYDTSVAGRVSWYVAKTGAGGINPPPASSTASYNDGLYQLANTGVYSAAGDLYPATSDTQVYPVEIVCTEP